jgi:hypothetical protein
MDGTRDRSPERMAENWRREDRVRRVATARSRSGLPGHAAFAAAAPAAAGDVIIDIAPRRLPSEAAVIAAPKPDTEVAKDIRPSSPMPSSSRLERRNKAAAISLSLGAAAGVVIIAWAAVLLLRPDVEVQPTPVAAAAVVGTPEALQPASALLTVHLRVSAGLQTAERQRIQAALAKAGYGTVVVQQMPFSISRSRVGYFREADRAAAEALIAALRGTHEVLELRDYSKYMSVPEPGRLDLWVRS